jgi:hypothetical protein
MVLCWVATRTMTAIKNDEEVRVSVEVSTLHGSVLGVFRISVVERKKIKVVDQQRLAINAKLCSR